MKPISVINNKPARTTQNVTYRQITEGGMYKCNNGLKARTGMIRHRTEMHVSCLVV
jgi:hypothetical protein